MSQLPSTVFLDGAPDLATAFPTFLPRPERLIWQYVYEATRTRIRFPDDASIALTLPLAFTEPPALVFDPHTPTTWGYEIDDGGRTVWVDDEFPVIPVRRGLALAYPGVVPAIAVGLGDEPEDAGADAEGGGFAGDVYAYGPLTFPVDGSGLSFPTDQQLAQYGTQGLTFQGACVGAASYYYEPLLAPVVVSMIHENRDERDRLHDELRRTLRPLTRILPALDPLIHRVGVSNGQRQDLPIDEAPNLIYSSLFTVEVHYEMLEARDVVGPGGVISAVTPTVTPDSTIPIQPEG